MREKRIGDRADQKACLETRVENILKIFINKKKTNQSRDVAESTVFWKPSRIEIKKILNLVRDEKDLLLVIRLLGATVAFAPKKIGFCFGLSMARDLNCGPNQGRKETVFTK